MRVADYIIDRLNKKYGIKYISLLTGNGALVLDDAVAKCKDITPICVHHEQNAGDFAIGFSKYTNKLSVVMVTTGCAATNTITSVLSAFHDHVPILFLSGNISLKHTSRYHRLHNNINLKKLGNQEADIIEIVKSITKYSIMIEDKNEIKCHLDKAIDIALTPPYGPVWIDIPSDLGGGSIEEKDLIEYKKPLQHLNEANWVNKVKNLIKDIETYDRVVVLCGNGIRLSETKEQLKLFIEKFNIPLISTYGAIDIIDHNHPLKIGICGVRGDRAGNFTIQNSNLLIVLGACLNIPQIGYDGSKFANRAKKVVVDICAENHRKNIIKIDKIIECDLKEFFKEILK